MQLNPLYCKETVQNHNMIVKSKMIQPEGYKRPKTPFMSPVKETPKGNESYSRPVVTIDDLEALAQQLLAGIEVLKSYKYPLAVRRGVKRP
jgi:hypothetical protein